MSLTTRKLVLALPILALVAGACGSSSPTTAPSQAATTAPTTAPVESAAPTTAPVESAAAEDFTGVTVNVATFTGPPIYEPLSRYAPEWEKLTGGKINFTTYPFSDLYQKSLTDVSSGTNSFTMMTLAAPWLVDFAAPGYIEDLSSRVTANAEIQWDDVQPFFKDFVGSYDGKVYGVVIDGDHLMAYYRTDILGADGTAPPTTWDEYLKVAEKYNGKDLDGDGTPDYGSCIQKARSGVGTWLFNGVLSSYSQALGTNQGVFFGDNMAPLVNNEAMGAALDFWKASSAFGPPDEINLDQSTGRGLFTAGRCALTLDWGDTGVLAIDPATSKVMDKVGAVIMPGSDKVLDRASGKLVACDATTCPNAIDGINHAPYAAFGGWAAVINAAAESKAKDAAFSFIAYASAPERSNKDVTIGKTGMNPYRISQVNDLKEWLAAGFSQTAAENYVGAIKASLASPNMALDLRVPQANQYTNVLEDQAIAQFLAGELSKEDAMKQMEDGWNQLTDQIGRDSQAAAYAASLGVAR